MLVLIMMPIWIWWQIIIKIRKYDQVWSVTADATRLWPPSLLLGTHTWPILRVGPTQGRNCNQQSAITNQQSANHQSAWTKWSPGISTNDSSGWWAWFVSRHCRRILRLLLHRRHQVHINLSIVRTVMEKYSIYGVIVIFAAVLVKVEMK